MSGFDRLTRAHDARNTARFQGAQEKATFVVADLTIDSARGLESVRATNLKGEGDFTVPMRGQGAAQVGDHIEVTYPRDSPTGPFLYVRHVKSANPTPQIPVDPNKPDPQWAAPPSTSSLIPGTNGVQANLTGWFYAVEEKHFPEGYTISFRLDDTTGEWAESGFVPHLGGLQHANLGENFLSGANVSIRARAHYAGNSLLSPGLDTRTVQTAVDTVSPGAATGLTVDTSTPGALNLFPQGTLVAGVFDHWEYAIATSAGGAGLVTRTGPAPYLFTGSPGDYYLAVTPISKSGVAGGRYPGSGYAGPFALLGAFVPDTTPPPDWAVAPVVTLTRNSPPTGGEQALLTVTLPTSPAYPYPADYKQTIVRGQSAAGFVDVVIPNGAAATPPLVVPFGTWIVNLIGEDTAGNRSGASPSASVSLAPSGIPGAMGNVTTQSGSEAVIVRWTTIAGALGYKVWRATSSGGAGATIVALVDGGVYPDMFQGLGAAGTVYYYKVQAFNLSGDGAISPTWVAGTVGGVDGRNLVAATVTAGKLEADLVLGSIIRTPANAAGSIGLYGNAGNAALYAFDAASVPQAAVNGAGLTTFRDGVNPRATFLNTGVYLYSDLGNQRVKLVQEGLYIEADTGAPGDRLFVADFGSGVVLSNALLDLSPHRLFARLDTGDGDLMLRLESGGSQRSFTVEALAGDQLGFVPSDPGMVVVFACDVAVNGALLTGDQAGGPRGLDYDGTSYRFLTVPLAQLSADGRTIRMYHTGASGDGHIEGSEGAIYLNWLAGGGGGLVVGNGASTYGPVAASAFNISSSKEFKRSIRDLTGMLPVALALVPRRYARVGSPPDAREEFGMVAEEVEPIAPNAVVMVPAGQGQDDTRALNHGTLLAILWQAFREHVAAAEARLATAEATIADQGAQLAALLTRVAALEALSGGKPQTQ